MPIATTKDIAERAGISRQTVSLILNGHADRLNIALKTQKRVREIAEQLGYCRNELANAVRRGHGSVIGVLGGGGLHVLSFLNGISHELRRKNFTLNFSELRYGKIEEDLAAFAKVCISQMIPAVICSTPTKLETVADTFDRHGIQLIILNSTLMGDRYPVVSSDEIQGAGLAVEHLYGLGHRRIGIVTVETESTYSENRKQGFREMLERCGGVFDPSLEFRAVNAYQYSSGEREAFREYIQRNRPTALFAVADIQAAKMLMYARELGIRVPQDLSVVGFSNAVYTEFSAPPLTTVIEPLEKIGVTAAKMALQAVSGEKSLPGLTKIPCGFIIRQSTERIQK